MGALKRSKYVHIFNMELTIADVINTEYCGETCKIYFAKYRVCYSLHLEPCILRLKGAWFLIKHS